MCHATDRTHPENIRNIHVFLPDGDFLRRLLLLVADGQVGIGLQEDLGQLATAHRGGDVNGAVAVLRGKKGIVISSSPLSTNVFFLYWR